LADIVVDTDVFIDDLRGAQQLAPGRHRLHYSVITRAELFAGNTASDLVSTLGEIHRWLHQPGFDAGRQWNATNRWRW
jgi:predicted nucleic acid-binding protein